MPYQDWLPILRGELQKEIEKSPEETRSPTHQSDHSERVWRFAKVLGEKTEADLEIVVAAVFLHDLARHYGHEFHGPKSAEMAEPVLERIGFPKEKREAVLDAITAHDYQTSSSARKSIEAKVLFDADKLDVFGKIGIERLTEYYLKTRGAEFILNRLYRCWEGLGLEESRKLGKDNYEMAVSHFKKMG